MSAPFAAGYEGTARTMNWLHSSAVTAEDTSTCQSYAERFAVPQSRAPDSQVLTFEILAWLKTTPKKASACGMSSARNVVQMYCASSDNSEIIAGENVTGQ